MRILRSHLSIAFVCAALAEAAAAQEPAPSGEPTPPAAETAPVQPPNEEGRARRPRRQPIVIEAGTVHPVAGPAIQNGVVVVRGERIVAVGKQGEVELPPNAVVRSFPNGHVYPGLVDAATDAYTDPALRGAGDMDAGLAIADDLHERNTRDDELVRAGITTAYVSVRSPSLLRGQGTLVRPRQEGFDVWEKREQVAVHLRLTNGIGPSHALQRQQFADGASAVFEGLDEYRKARTDHEEALKKYEKDFADYLAWHQKKKDGDKPPAAAPGTEGPAGPPRRERGNRGGGDEPPKGTEPPKNEPPKNDPPKSPDAPSPSAPSDAELEQALATLFAALAQDPKPQDPPKQEPKKEGGEAAPPPAAAPAEKKDEAPKRPTYPKAPPRDPQKDALLRVLDGELALRVEAHRADELRAALELQTERKVPVLVLEQAFGASAVAADIANQGASVVVTDVWPGALPAPYDTFDPTALPRELHAAGVPFAIASGSARRADVLPLMAAAAVGRGLDAEAALRAITLTPAEILGVAKDTGSLQPGKLADVVVCDRPLLASDSRVLFVLAKGRTEYEAK